jgi:Flp pilus assembly protein TadG
MKSGSSRLTPHASRFTKVAKKRNSEKGAAVVEFALLALLLLVFVFGIIEFGFIWMQSHYIANAAREGARVASKLEDPTSGDDLLAVQNAIKNYLRGAVVYSDTFIDSNSGSPKNVDVSVVPRTITATGVTLDGIEVDVTVQTARIWEPVLWNLLNLVPGIDVGEIRQIRETALFPVLNN